MGAKLAAQEPSFQTEGDKVKKKEKSHDDPQPWKVGWISTLR
jgi:hypothetical protein